MCVCMCVCVSWVMSKDVSDVLVCKAGERVGASEAALLNMLNISPFMYVHLCLSREGWRQLPGRRLLSPLSPVPPSFFPLLRPCALC